MEWNGMEWDGELSTSALILLEPKYCTEQGYLASIVEAGRITPSLLLLIDNAMQD
jgi:hypothetical protein